MDILIYAIFFGVPIGAVAFFVSSLIKFLDAKKNNAQPEELKKRKLLLILSCVIAGGLVLSVVGIIALVMLAIAYM